MIATRDATEVASQTNLDDNALNRVTDDAPKSSVSFFSDNSFGTVSQCAADALLVKRLALIVVPTIVLICLVTQALAWFSA